MTFDDFPTYSAFSIVQIALVETIYIYDEHKPGKFLFA